MLKSTSTSNSTEAASERTRISRRYPEPEIVQLPIKSTSSTAAPTSSLSSSSYERAGATKSLPTSSGSLSLRLHWGLQATELRRVLKLHEDVYPINFNVSYYSSLLDHDTCMCLVALVTEETYKEWLGRRRETKEEEEEAAAAMAATPLEGASSSPLPSCNSTQPRHPPPVSQCSVSAEALEERAQVEGIIAEQESLAARNNVDGGRGDADGVTQTEGIDAAKHTVVIGFIIGQHAYARHDDGRIFPHPTSYINSFAVDPPFQMCGVGHTLLHRFITYVTQQRPLYAQDYLHYDERKLMTHLVNAKIKKRHAGLDNRCDDTALCTTGRVSSNGSGGDGGKGDDSAAARSQSSGAASSSPSLLQSLVSLLSPEFEAWMEDRRARRLLRARGMTEDEVDQQRFRERLAPDMLTDEEVAEVRDEAREFVVQVGLPDVWLHCLSTNTTAITFYEHHNFQLRRVMDRFYIINGTSYNGNLFHYVCGGNGLPASSALPSVSSCDTTGDAPAEKGDAAKKQMKCLAQGENKAIDPADVGLCTAVTSASSMSKSLFSPGLRRRRGVSTAGKEGSDLPEADPPSPCEADRDVTIGAAAAATTTTTTISSVTTKVKSAESAGFPGQGSRSEMLRLSPSTYPFVADIILNPRESAEGEWRRCQGSSGTGGEAGLPPGPWEVVREAMLLINAGLLLCAVCWVGYNVVLTGKVE